ncbi:MAG TPA: hypothetical protein VHY91_02060 [Pirellulales bacterium]|jgi:uncharacterized protein involved in copper resistance|nr:hypothetical protein [Pirellulales bacterium]
MKSLVLLAPLSIALMLTSAARAGQPASGKGDAAMDHAAMDHAGMAGMDHASPDSVGMGSMDMGKGVMSCPMCKAMGEMSMGSGAATAKATGAKAVAPAGYQRPPGRRCGRC